MSTSIIALADSSQQGYSVTVEGDFNEVTAKLAASIRQEKLAEFVQADFSPGDRIAVNPAQVFTVRPGGSRS